MNLIEVKKLNVGFNTNEGFKQALFDVNFEIKKGKILAIVGESGCGKTLSAMSILNLLPKNAKILSGEIIYSNEGIQNIDLLKQTDKELQKIRGSKIALIPQDPMSALNPLYTIGNQLLEVIKLHNKKHLSKKEYKEIAINALKEVQIPNPEERLNAYPHELSGGMKQRVIIAMAIICNADVIIADEPTTALDVTVQAQIIDLLNKIKKEKNTSIILITHDLALVYQNADEVLVMYAGRVVEYANQKVLFASPKHPYTKALFKAIPDMNSEKLAVIEGQPPSIDEQISGCAFHPRCNVKLKKCETEIPKLKIKFDNSQVACFYCNNEL